jgi:hypothetical protein
MTDENNKDPHKIPRGSAFRRSQYTRILHHFCSMNNNQTLSRNIL